MLSPLIAVHRLSCGAFLIPSHAWNSTTPPRSGETDSLNPNTARLLRAAPGARQEPGRRVLRARKAVKKHMIRPVRAARRIARPPHIAYDSRRNWASADLSDFGGNGA